MKDCELCRHFVLYVTSRFVTALLLSDIIKMYTIKQIVFVAIFVKRYLIEKTITIDMLEYAKQNLNVFTVTIRLSFHRIAHYMSTWSIRINYLSVITVALNSWTRESIKDTSRHARYSTTF